MSRLRRFVVSLQPSRTDLWDFRTYGFAGWFSAIRLAWLQTSPTFDLGAYMARGRYARSHTK